MEIDEKQEFTSPLPVLPRLDRLDRLLQLLEEKHNALSEKHIPEPVLIGDMEAEEKQEDKTCRTLSNALDEVHHKGTLMERLEMLEKRVLQLSLEIDEQNTSKSSTSSTIAVSEKFGNNSSLSSVTKDDQDVTSSTLEGRPDPLLAGAKICSSELNMPYPSCRRIKSMHKPLQQPRRIATTSENRRQHRVENGIAAFGLKVDMIKYKYHPQL